MDVEVVDAVGRRTGVEDVDDVVAIGAAAPGGGEDVPVGRLLAVQGQGVAGGDCHGLQPVDHDQVLAGPAGRAVRRDAARGRRGVGPVDARLAAQVRRVQGDRVGVLVPEDASQVARADRRVDRAGAGRAQRTGRHGAVEVDVGAAAGVEVAEVAVDVDPPPGQDLRAQGDRHGGSEDDVVTGPQQDPARQGVDRHRVEGRVGDQDVALAVLRLQEGADVLRRRVGSGEQARDDQVEVLALPGRLPHRQPDVAGECLRQHHVQPAHGLGEVDVVRGFDHQPAWCCADQTRALRVDLEVVARGVRVGLRRPDAAARRAQLDVVGLDVRQAPGAAVAGAAVAAVHDRPGEAAQRGITTGEHPVDRQGAGRLGDEDAEGAGGGAQVVGAGREDARREAGSRAVGLPRDLRVGDGEHPEGAADPVDLDLQEVAEGADPTATGVAADAVIASGHRDAAGDDVRDGRIGAQDAGAVLGIEDRCRGAQEHVAKDAREPGRRGGDVAGRPGGAAAGRPDLADPQVAGRLGDGDRAVGLGVDPAEVVGAAVDDRGATGVGPGRVDVRQDEERDGRGGGRVGDGQVASGDQTCRGAAVRGAEPVVAVDVRQHATEGHEDERAADDVRRRSARIWPEVPDGGHRLLDRTGAKGCRLVVRHVAVHRHAADTDRVDALPAVLDGEHDIATGPDRADERREGRADSGGRRIAAQCREVEEDVDACLGGEHHRLRVRRRAEEHTRAVPLDEHCADWGCGRADGAPVGVEVEDVAGEDRTRADGYVTAVVADRGRADRVLDVAEDGEVVPGRRRLRWPSDALHLDAGRREVVLEVELPGRDRSRSARVHRRADDRDGTAAQRGVQRVDRDPELQGVVRKEHDRGVGSVRDLHRVPGVLQVEDRLLAVDGAVDAADGVGPEQRGRLLVVEDRVDEDR